MVGSPLQKCYFHDTQKNVRREIMEGGRRHSRFLPADLDKLYVDAVTNPDLIDLSDNIALLEAKIQQTLLTSTSGDPVPKWSDLREAFSYAVVDLLGADEEKKNAAIESVFKMLDAGMRWDKTWDAILPLIEQSRKLTETEVKRKKELHQMIPVERVIVLMGELGRIVKRNVSNLDEIQAVYRELAMLAGTNDVPGRPGVRRIPSRVTNLNPDEKGLKGGGSRRAVFRRKAVEARMRAEAAESVNPDIIDATPTEDN